MDALNDYEDVHWIIVDTTAFNVSIIDRKTFHALFSSYFNPDYRTLVGSQNPDIAPNSYNINRDFANSKPKYSMGKRLTRNVGELSKIQRMKIFPFKANLLIHVIVYFHKLFYLCQSSH